MGPHNSLPIKKKHIFTKDEKKMKDQDWVYYKFIFLHLIF